VTTAPHTHDEHEHDHDHDRGLGFDLPKLLERRRMLKMFGGGAALAALAGAGILGTSRRVAMAASCVVIPNETEGPFPGDGSNGPNALTQSGIVRSDIRSSFGANTGTAKGVPLTINLTILDTARKCAALAGAAVYLWHCNQDGLYSLYSPGVADQNYLRGVQTTDKSGRVRFRSIFPACYSGRWPHIHFEVYPSVAKATTASGRIATSQVALPEDACRTVFATDGYRSSLSNLSRVTLAGDNVFGDGSNHQLGTVAGSVGKGFTVELSVPIKA
jgi:protocatechuate 3,4-dioxygenase beta subunit